VTSQLAMPPASETRVPSPLRFSTLSAVAVRERAGRVAPAAAAALSRVQWAFDALAAAASMWLAAASPIPTALYAAGFLLIAGGAGLYDRRARAPRALLGRTAVVAVLAGAATVGSLSLFGVSPSSGAMAGAVALSVPLVLLPHLAVWWARQLRPRRVLFTGGGPLGMKLAEAVAASAGGLYEIVLAPVPDGVDVEGLVGLCRAEGVDEIVLPDRSRDAAPVLVPALHCLPLGCRIRGEADFYEDLVSAVPVLHVSAEWMLSRGLDTSNPMVESLKRMTDVMLASIALVVAAPILVLAIAAIALAGAGPVLYAQTRCGRYGRPFRMWKLRTMRVGAEQGEVLWATERDPRCTALGRFLRRTRIDEIPQVVNILLGEMSFVGPRPERPEFVEPLERLIPFYGWRHFVRPGLTGWAQINLPYGSGVEDARRKLEYDLHYIRHHSLLRDLSIVLRTAAAVLRGAR
jgi:exopolysaccharide biosynthesis polyprenyl glycosylphosphotransferase